VWAERARRAAALRLDPAALARMVPSPLALVLVLVLLLAAPLLTVKRLGLHQATRPTGVLNRRSLFLVRLLPNAAIGFGGRRARRFGAHIHVAQRRMWL
jgi:hypothetical protein